MRNTFSEALYKAATANPDIYIVVADISPAGSMAKFRDQYPDRFINVGVAEQSMIGICAGLALPGPPGDLELGPARRKPWIVESICDLSHDAPLQRVGKSNGRPAEGFPWA